MNRSLIAATAALGLLGCKGRGEPAKKAEPSPVASNTGATAGADAAPPCAIRGYVGIADAMVRDGAHGLWSDGSRALAIAKDDNILEWRDPCWQVVADAPRLDSPATHPVFAAYHGDALWLAFLDGRTARRDGDRWVTVDAPSTRIDVVDTAHRTDGTDDVKSRTVVPAQSFTYAPRGWWSPGGYTWTFSDGDLWENSGNGWLKLGLPRGIDKVWVVHRRAADDLLADDLLAVTSAGVLRWRARTWTSQKVKVEGLPGAAFTDNAGMTYLPQGGAVLAFDGASWTPAVREADVDFDAVCPTGPATLATGVRFTDNHTHAVGREWYRLDGKRFVKDPTAGVPTTNPANALSAKPVVFQDVVIVGALDEALVYDGGWRVVTR